MDVPVKEKVVPAGSIQTHYLKAGRGRPVLLLHGASAGAVTWYPVIGPLSAHFQVIAPDIVGYGASDKPPAVYNRFTFSAWLRDFLDAIAITRASIVGNSQGGPTALQFAIENPERVDRLVLVDSMGFGKDISFGAIISKFWLTALPSMIAAKWFNRYLAHDPKCIHESWVEYALEVYRMRGGRNVFKQGRKQIGNVFSIEELSQISQRTLIVWGANDIFFPLDHGVKGQERIPAAQLHVIPGAGHIPFLDKPDEFNEVIIRFLK
jgi:4,5:9,10-diseco-3-hydroxy-5,9,17-trioxoandrosta-1(10),2-diene-4-oate hydrolase